MSRSRSSGFTLVELMVAIAVLAILTTLALPSFQETLRSNRVATSSNELLTSFTLARSEAIRSTRGAGVCASADGATCGNDWNAGWLVWNDSDSDGALDAGENIVRYSQAKAQMALLGSVTSIAFDARGRASGGLQTIGVKPYGHDAPVRCVTVNATGQVKIGRAACP
mgnify:CR=1 FL=1